MLFGVGIDIIEVDRIEDELEKHGEKFTRTVFTSEEIAYCERRVTKQARAQCFAGRFSAKEAFFKAIGTGLRQGLHWRDVEVSHNELGNPSLVLKEKALELVSRMGVSHIRVSISHTKMAAVAVVILEK
jgi:holo-[acyl-carrier protein] synthase